MNETIQERGYKWQDIIQDGEIKTQIMKDKITTKYLRRVRKLAKSELYARNMFMGINQCVLVGIGYFDWAGVDLGVMDRKERKNTCDGLFYARANVRLYLKRSEGERGLISAKDCVLGGCTLKKVIKEDFMVENEEKRSIIEGLNKGMKPTRKK